MSESIAIQVDEKSQIGSWLAWFVCLIAALFFFYEFVQMNMFSAITDAITREFHLDGAQLGLLSATYFAGDVIFLIPAGMILDRLSTRTIILLSMALCVFGTFLFAFGTNLWFLGVCRFLTGIGNAFAFLACMRLATRWFLPQRLGLVIGVIVTMAMLGGAVAQTPLILLVDSMGWRHALMVDALVGLLILLAIYCSVSDYPAESQQAHAADLQQVHALGIWRSLWRVLQNKQNWFAGFFTSFLNLAIFILGAMWGVLYLQQAKHLAATQATTVSMMVYIGTIVGSPLFGLLSDKLRKRKWPMLFGAILSLLTVCAIIFTPRLSYISYMILFFLLGLFTGSQVLGYTVINESNQRVVTSTATGLAALLIMAAGFIFQPLFGWLLDYHWLHVFKHGQAFYTAHDFMIALLILPITFFIAVLAAWLLRETNARTHA